jgi:adenine phosphoribosyltransferase
MESVRAAIRDVPDFPRPGILFKDITPVLADPALFRKAVDWFVDRARACGAGRIAAVESRGFVFGAAAAYALGLGFIPVRKKGKLPHRTVSISYALEYGAAELEIHADALAAGDRVLLIDDVLATGGTARAAADLIARLGAEVAEAAFLVELSFLRGREKLGGLAIAAPIVF